QSLVLPRVVRGVKAAGHPEVAVYALAPHEVLDPGEGIVTLLQDRIGRLGAVPTRQLRVTRLDRGADLPAVARAAAPAGVLGIEHQGRAAAARDLQGRAEAGVARSDHRDVDRLRQRRPVEPRARR